MSNLPAEWDLLNKIWHIIQQQVEEEILLSSEVQDEIEKHIESHTAAHTAELRERVKELETENERYREALDRIVSKAERPTDLLLGATVKSIVEIAKEALKNNEG